MKTKIILFYLFVVGIGTIYASNTQVDGIWYDFNSDKLTASVTYQGSYYGYANEYFGSIIIPSTVTYNAKIYNVTSIGENAFRNNSSLTSVTIPNSITSIGKFAFQDCSGLTSVTIPNSVSSIGNAAFYGCTGLTSVTINSNVIVGNDYTEKDNLKRIFGSQVKKYLLGESITHIGDYTFYNCDSLISVNIPENVTLIGSHAFYGCSDLTSITISNSVTRLDTCAFSNCSSLTSVTIPNSVTSIGAGAFNACSNLTSIEIPNSVTSIESGAFFGCSGLISVTIPKSVTSIEDRTFYECTRLTSVNIFSGVKSIGEEAFYRCSNLLLITIPKSVTSIGDRAFYRCSNLISVTIPNSVTSIGSEVFIECSGLTFVSIGNHVSNIGVGAFSGCTKLTSIYAKPTTPPQLGGSYVFYKVPSSAYLYVPYESISLYSSADQWKNFNIDTLSSTSFVVRFVDWNGTVLHMDEIEEGDDAIAPSNPTREGYTFIGWSDSCTNITDNMTIMALYRINRYEVIFVDWDGTILKTDSVNYGYAAIAPQVPDRPWYTFTGWDKSYSRITKDIIITATYSAGRTINYSVLFSNTIDDSKIVTGNVSITFPVPPDIEGFRFVGWRPVAELLDDSMEIQAIYEAELPDSTPEEVSLPNKSQKLIRNGNVYILYGDKTYTIQGYCINQ